MDLEQLFKPRLPEADVDIPGVGTVRVRGLSRAEAMKVQGANGVEATERVILSLGMVDPKMTEADAGKWQKACPATELDPVITKISELSGLTETSPKEAMKTFEAQPEVEFRVLPGAEARDDGSSASPGDE